MKENWRLYHTLYYDIVERQTQSQHEQYPHHHRQPQRQQHPKRHIATRDVVRCFLELRDEYRDRLHTIRPQTYKPRPRWVGSIWYPVAPSLRRNEETYSRGFDPECRTRVNPQIRGNISKISYSWIDDARNSLPIRSTQFSTLPRRRQNIHMHTLLNLY